jgi:xanthine dehydrogenase accessory factor
MDAWPHHGLEDDLRPRMADMLAQGRAFALVTVSAADGGPRGVGAQMVVTDNENWGFDSGGCIEAEVAIQARLTLADGEPRRLVYGRGSPWIDTRLPCGGRLDLLAERIRPDDAAIAALIGANEQRRTVRYQSDGVRRRCIPPTPLSPAPGSSIMSSPRPSA